MRFLNILLRDGALWTPSCLSTLCRLISRQSSRLRSRITFMPFLQRFHLSLLQYIAIAIYCNELGYKSSIVKAWNQYQLYLINSYSVRLVHAMSKRTYGGSRVNVACAYMFAFDFLLCTLYAGATTLPVPLPARVMMIYQQIFCALFELQPDRHVFSGQKRVKANFLFVGMFDKMMHKSSRMNASLAKVFPLVMLVA